MFGSKCGPFPVGSARSIYLAHEHATSRRSVGVNDARVALQSAKDPVDIAQSDTAAASRFRWLVARRLIFEGYKAEQVARERSTLHQFHLTIDAHFHTIQGDRKRIY
jgi:hypothetical protein